MDVKLQEVHNILAGLYIYIGEITLNSTIRLVLKEWNLLYLLKDTKLFKFRATFNSEEMRL